MKRFYFIIAIIASVVLTSCNLAGEEPELIEPTQTSIFDGVCERIDVVADIYGMDIELPFVQILNENKASGTYWGAYNGGKGRESDNCTFTYKSGMQGCFATDLDVIGIDIIGEHYSDKENHYVVTFRGYHTTLNKVQAEVERVLGASYSNYSIRK